MRKYYILQFTRPNVVGKMVTDTIAEIQGGDAKEFKDVSEVERWMQRNRETLYKDAEYRPKLTYKVTQ